MARGVSQEQEQRLREKEEEIRAHTTASTAIKGDLDSWYVNVIEYILPFSAHGNTYESY